VVQANGHVVASTATPDLVAVWRSCAKPFQVMPFLASGEFDRLGWGPDELALSCASHGGEPEHVAIASRMLDALGLEEGDLACGVHEPLSRRGARLLAQHGEHPGRLHNNCSGKHASMLALARGSGWPSLGYERWTHPVQRGALREVSRWSGVAEDAIERVTDGCGVLAFALPLTAMAHAFARLGSAAAQGEEIPSRIVRAMSTRPFLVGGTERFDTVLIEQTGGRIISKVGAEGVHSVSIPDASLGLAIKVEDGAQRAQHPAVLRLLQHLDQLPETLPPALAEFLVAPVLNTRAERVGEVRPAD
jgi:L-asparaginase II